jgi:hypothetical protein
LVHIQSQYPVNLENPEILSKIVNHT